jgi:O-antigen ligase
LVIVSFAGYLGWAQLKERLRTVFADDLSGRVEIYENARKMAAEFSWFGSGPGTFASLYILYRTGPEQEWQAWVHDDWLETRITFGWIGSLLVLLMLVIALVRWFGSNGIRLPRTTVRMFWLALAGCLVQARFDFPLQVYSVLFLFVLWCSLLFCLSRE